MDKYTIEFRIEGATLIPSEVTKLLKLNPCETRVSDNQINKKNKNSLWSYDGISSENNFIESEWDSLEEGLLFILDKLLPKQKIIQSELRMHKKYLWCGHFQEDFDSGSTFSPKLFKKLALFDTELILSNYCSA